MCAVFAEVRRVLADDGTLFLNLGDSYSGGGGGNYGSGKSVRSQGGQQTTNIRNRPDAPQNGGLPAKNLLGIPWRVAFALQDDGWILRNDIIWCLSGGAWVYARTAKGDMPVMVKDLIRLDPSTIQLWNGEKWSRVLGWGRSTDESERVELVLRSGERIGATGGHLWPTRRGNVASRDLAVGDVIATCALPEPEGAVRPEYLTDDVLWLCGLYLAEGSRSSSTIQLSLCADEVRWLPRIAAAVRHMGGTMRSTVEGNTLAVRMWGKVLTAVIDDHIGGKVAVDKHLTTTVWNLPNDALRHIVTGYLDGDGHYDLPNGRIRIGFTRNYALQRDLRTLAARLGATLTLNPNTSTCQTGTFKSFKGEWRWERSGHWNEKDRGEVIAIRGSHARKFWDIAVEDEPHLFALASGVLTHNCKPNGMPESVTDRLSTKHEHVFMFSKRARYWFDLDPIRERYDGDREPTRRARNPQDGWKENSAPAPWSVQTNLQATGERHTIGHALGRNPGDVWSIATQPFASAHFAVMPQTLASRAIEAGCKPDGVVLDPFSGSGTTGLAAAKHGKRYVGIDLSAEYLDLSLRTRLAQTAIDFGEATA